MTDLRRWAVSAAREQPDVLRIGCLGSFARGYDWGVRSDIDIIAIVTRSTVPFERRGAAWNTLALPVPADVMIYTQDEWTRMAATKFGQTVLNEAVWLYPDSGSGNLP